MDIITICGDPLKYESEITYIAERMTCTGEYCVLTPVIPFVKNPGILGYNATEIGRLNDAHRKKIDMSNSILAMDVDGYIDSVLKYWIEYAKQTNKKVLYYSQGIHNYR